MSNESQQIEDIAKREGKAGFHIKFHWQNSVWECVLLNNAQIIPNYQPRGYGENQLAAYREAHSDREAAFESRKYKLVSQPVTSQPMSTLKAGLPR